MNQKLNRIVKVVLSCMLVCFLSCESEESLNNNQELAQQKTQAEKIKDAEKWFNAYRTPSKTGKSTDGEINKAFRNIDYYWENAGIISFENDSTAVVVPIKDNPEDLNYKGQKMLYLYPENSKYQSVIQEIFPDSEAIIDDNQKREGFENLNSFSGYIITWDLKKGFIKGARFKNDIITEEVTNVKMVFDVDKKTNRNFTGKVAPMFDEGDGVGAEREITVRGGTAATPLNNVIVTQKSPAPTPKDLSIAGAVNATSGLNGYINTPTGGGGGGNGNTSSGISSIKSVNQLKTAINNTDVDAKEITFVQNGKVIVSSATIGLLPWLDLMISVTQTQVGEKYVVNNVVSNPIGVTTGFSWSQTSYGQVTSGNITTVTLVGISSINLFVQSVGTVYSSPVSYSINIDNRTGKLITARRLLIKN